MKGAHVRERHAPAGTPFRLAEAFDAGAEEWLDLEVARRRLAAADPRRAHNGALFRHPVSTLDAHLAGRYLEPGDVVTLRIDRLGELRTPIAERPAADR